MAKEDVSEVTASCSEEEVQRASAGLSAVMPFTPLQRNRNLSAMFGADIYLKREDLTPVRSYKIRGAYNFMSRLDREQLAGGVVCASAGNHGQGVAYSCSLLRTKGLIVLPRSTPAQKVARVHSLGGSQIRVELAGDTFDDAYAKALAQARKLGAEFVHPFDHARIIEGQATIGYEIMRQMDRPVDVLVVPVGGGGLMAGLGRYVRNVSPATRLVGAQPVGADAMRRSLAAGYPVVLDAVDGFVDGVAVRRVGDRTFSMCRSLVDEIVLADKAALCGAIIQLYQDDAIVAEPAGALSVAALNGMAERIRGKTVVCIISGGNNDIRRLPEIMAAAPEACCASVH